MAIPVYSVKVPEYDVRKMPDHALVGAKIDRVIKKRFLGQKVAIRCLGSQEHRGKPIGELVAIIKKMGTDKYDPARTGEKYDNVENKRIDFFALDFKITEKGNYMEKFIEPFYTYPIQEGRKPIRIDIVIVYDIAKLRCVVHRYEGRNDVKRDGFVFKDPENKPTAVKGIVKVL